MLTIPDKAGEHGACFAGVGVVKIPCTAAAQLALYIYADYAGLASWGRVDRGGAVTLRAAFQIHLVRSPVVLAVLLYIPRIGPGGVSSRGLLHTCCGALRQKHKPYFYSSLRAGGPLFNTS